MSRRYKRMREIYEFQIDRSLPIEGGEDLREESREKIDGNQRERERKKDESSRRLEREKRKRKRRWRLKIKVLINRDIFKEWNLII